MVRLSKLEKSYPSGMGRVHVLRHITLNIRPGEFVTIMGPSGAGKSTLLSILGLLDADWTGSYELAGHRVEKMRTKARQALGREMIGFVFQHYHLLDDLTVYENLDVPLSYRNVPRRERQSRVADVLDRFQIVAKKDLRPPQLSGGQQQLVGVARAVVAEPKLILADEPTGSLHSSQGVMIMDLLKELNRQGTTIVQVTHNPEYAKYGDRIVEMKDGWIVNGQEGQAE